jgi:nitrate reductase NapAB chaperone NapD
VLKEGQEGEVVIVNQVRATEGSVQIINDVQIVDGVMRVTNSIRAKKAAEEEKSKDAASGGRSVLCAIAF